VYIEGSTTFLSEVITTTNTAGIAVGMFASGPGVVSGATVTSFVANTSITISVAIPYNFTNAAFVFTAGPNISNGMVRCWAHIDSEWMEYTPDGLFETSSFFATTSTSSPTMTAVFPDVAIFPLAGLLVQGPGITPGTYIESATSTTITLSANPTENLTNAQFTIPAAIWVFRGTGGNLDNVNFGRTNTDTSSSPAIHTVTTEVDNAIQLQGNPIDVILKMYLSGQQGPWLTNVQATSLNSGVAAGNYIAFPVNVVLSYGLATGDSIKVIGSLSGNDGYYTVTGITNDPSGNPNRYVLVTPAFAATESPFTPGTLNFWSQYNTLPTLAGLGNTPPTIDVAGFQTALLNYFSNGLFNVQLFIQGEVTGKSFLEDECFLPFGAYSITRQGQLSIAVTAPPLSSVALVTLDDTNVIKPENITIQRATNTRRFYNLVQYTFDEDDQGDFLSTVNFLNADTEATLGLTSQLPIPSLGIKTALDASLYAVNSRGQALLTRYSDCAFEITLSVTWGAGSQIEVGDIVLLNDPGTLNITNLETGERGLGQVLLEVINRTLKPQSGTADLILLGNLGYTGTGRYATIAPSSVIAAGASTVSVILTDSYGPDFPGDEPKKWAQLIGTKLTVHSPTWSNSGSAVFTGFNPSNPYQMLFASTLGYTPAAGDIVDVAEYGTGTSSTFNATAKLLYTFINPSIAVALGASGTAFNVASGDIGTFILGQPVQLHVTTTYAPLPNGAVLSLESVVTAIDPSTPYTVTLETNLGFTPSSADTVELIGFLDSGAPYRLV
jgi:hypothetical protein